MAGVCAFVWSAYSLASRRFAKVPTSVVTWFCAATSVLSLACHFALEETVLPHGAGQWLAVLGLGLMPVGAAFYAWDHGVKHGNIQVLGAASYAAPLLSTLVLIATGFAEPSLTHPRRLPADHRRRGACRQVAAVPPLERVGRGGRLMLFPGGIEATANATLIMSAGAAVIYALIVNTRPTLARSAVKTLAVGASRRSCLRRKRPAAAVWRRWR